MTGCDSSGFTALGTSGSGSEAGGPFTFSDSGNILPNALTGQPYTVDFATSNGVSPVSYTVDAGTLPAGLSLNATGVLSGEISAAPGTYNFTLRATDSASNTITQNLTVSVSVPFSLQTRALPDAIVGSTYTAVLTAAGGEPPYSYAATNLPAGLALSGSTGLILGNATTTGNYTMAVTATDATGAFDTENVLLNVITPVSQNPSISTTTLPNGAVNSDYTAAIVVGGGVVPYHFTIISGALPNGLTLDPTQGLISGTPSSSGVSSFAVKVTDSIGDSVTQNYTLTVTAPPSPQISTTNLAAAVVGTPYAQVVTATLGITPYAFSVTSGSLPAGLLLDSNTGILSGTPTAAGTSTFTVEVTDSFSDTGTKVLSIVTTAPPAPVITTSSLANGNAGTAYVQSIGVTLGVLPYTFSISVGSLPAGLSIDSASGIISGTPTTSGTTSFTVKVTDNIGSTASQNSSKSLSLQIVAAAVPQLTNTSLPNGVVGTVYSSALSVLNGVTPYTFTISSGNLEAGLALDANTGIISGTPTASGDDTVTFQVTDSLGGNSNKTLSLTVIAPSPPVIGTTSLPSGVIGTPYAQVISVTSGVLPYAFSISSGSLPAGLSMSSTTGIISGTPTATGTASFTVKVTDNIGDVVIQGLSLVVSSTTPPSVTTTALSSGTVGSSYAQVISASGGVTPYTYSISTGSLPGGLSISSTTGLITGTPTASGTFNFTARVTDTNGNSGTGSLSIVISSAISPIITTSSVSNATAGIAYVQAISVSQGVLPYAFSISAGALPNGLSIDPNSGVISGTPSASGSASFTVKVTDNVGDIATKAYTMTVASPASPTITSTSLSSGTVGVPYQQVVLASGGTSPYSWSITSGTLQSGLSFSGTTGVISGTPTASGSVNLTFLVTDANSETATKTLTINIIAATAPQITNTSLSNGLIGTAYSAVLAGVNGTTPYTFSLTTGTLPAGLSLNANSGVISGTPTTAGTASLTFTITDSVSNSSTKSLTLQIVSPTPPSFSTTTLSNGTTESAYAAPISVSGGVTPYTFSLASGSLPTGMTLNGSSGILSGTPTVAGSSTFIVRVTDNIGATATQSLTLVIANPTAPAISTTSLASGTAGSTYMQTIQASGGYGTLTFAITSGTLQTGLSFSGSTGTISGIPTATGTVSLTFSVTDSLGSTSSQTLSLQVVSPAAPTITTNSLPGGVQQTAYAQVVGVTGGVPPYTFSLSSGSLPAGLNLNTSTGAISGTPTASGSNSFTVKVVDSLSSNATKSLSISINSPTPPSITNTSLAGGQVTVPYTQVVLASGGIQPYAFSITSGSLPAGVSLNSSTGALAGTPSASGTFNFTVTVTDSVSNSASQAYSVSINPSPYAILAFSNSTLLPVMLNNNETRSIGVTGGLPPYTWSISSGSVPSGMTLTTATGVISGAAAATGTSTFAVTVTDQRSTTISQSFSLVVSPILSVSTVSLPSAIAGVAYNHSVAATGGTAPYTFTSSGLPTGLSMSSSGSVSGTASVVGSYSVTVNVTDSNGLTAQSAISMVVAGALSITTSTLSVSNVSQSYSAVIGTSGGQAPLTFSLSIGTLPTGLSLNASTGLITGTPTAGTNARTKNFPITVQVADSASQVATKAFTLQVTIGPRVWDDISNKLRPAAVGIHYLDVPRETGGVGVLSWSASGLPSGLSMSSTSGYISGTPAAGSAGTYSVAITVTDANGSSGTRSKSLTVVSAGGTAGFDTSIVTPITTITGNIISFKMGNLTNHANGILDYVAVTSNSGANDIIVGINNGDGTFTNYAYQTTNPTLNWVPQDVVIADINNDSKLDLVILENNGTTSQIEVIEGDNAWTTGGAGMTRQYISLTGIGATFYTDEQLAVGDINGDGYKDIVFTSNNAGKAVVIMNCGSVAASVNITYNGSATACNNVSQAIFDYYTGPAGGISYTAAGAYGVALVNTHSTAYLDLLVTTAGNKTIMDFPSVSNNGTFGTAATYGPAFVSGSDSYLIRSGFDLDADGYQDVVIEGTDGAYALYGNGTGSFAGYTDITSTNIPSYNGFSAAVGDINGDGCPDVVTLSRNSVYFSTQVFLANKSGSTCQRSFAAQRVINSGYQVTGAVLGKVFSTTATNYNDLAIANTNWTQHIEVYKNNGSSTIPLSSYASTFSSSGPFFYAAPPAYDNQIQGAPAVGDINNDGYPDFILKTGGSATIYLGGPGGTYTAETTEVETGDVAATWWTERAIVLADVNGDGNLDFVAGNYNNNGFGSVAVTLGNGDGTFGSQQAFSVDQSGCTGSQGVYSVGVADFNRDGIPDLVVGQACNGTARISVFQGYGDGTFNTTSPTILTPAAGSYVDDIVVEDVNGDGIPDIVAAYYGNTMQIWKGVGNGTFTGMTAVSTGFSGNSSVSSLEVGDINNDGTLDFIFTQYNSSSWGMLQGNTTTGSGTTGAATQFNGPTTTTGLVWNSVRLVDWNSDGQLDVVGFKQNAGYLFYNSTGATSCGSGSFTAPTQPWLTANPGGSGNFYSMPAIIDLNGDGLPDILSANASGNTDSSAGVMYNYSTGGTTH